MIKSSFLQGVSNARKWSKAYVLKRWNVIFATALLASQYSWQWHYGEYLIAARVGHTRQFVHVAPKSIHLGLTSPWTIHMWHKGPDKSCLQAAIRPFQCWPSTEGNSFKNEPYHYLTYDNVWCFLNKHDRVNSNKLKINLK